MAFALDNRPPPAAKPPPSRCPVRRAVRAEPSIAIPAAALERWGKERPPAWTLAGAEPTLAERPVEPLRGPRALPQSIFWSAAVVASGVFHLAAALLFVSFVNDAVLIEGGEEAQVALLGNASEDQLAAGDGPVEQEGEVTSVSLIPMLDAKPVETVEAALVPVEDSAEYAEPEREAALDPLTPAALEPVAPETAPSPAASLVPEVLTTERIEAAKDTLSVPPPAPILAEPVIDAVETPRAEPVAEPQKPVPVTETPQAVAAETLQPVPEDPVAKPEKPVEQPKTKAAKTQKAVDRPVKKPATSKPESAKAKPEKPAAKAKPEKPAKKTAAKSGSKGSNQADAKRGDTDGAADGRSAGKSTGGKKASAAGNASVSNYPGKVVSKLRRALRYPAAARAKQLRGEVQVSFTVSAGGRVGGIRVVRSSGSPILDRAAVETVRRAAPFPAIPDGAGRSSWAFTVPLAFAR